MAKIMMHDSAYRLTKVKYGVPDIDTWVGDWDNAPFENKEIFDMDNAGNFDYYLTNRLRAASDPFTQIVSQSLSVFDGVGPFGCLLRGGLLRGQTLLATPASDSFTL